MRSFVLTLLSLLAFAGNSVLCRLALRSNAIDPVSFVTIRLGTGAITLALLVLFSSGKKKLGGNTQGAFFLLLYAVLFTFAYVGLSAGTGALLLFGAVQMTMILAGVRAGEKFTLFQSTGLVVALLGLIVLLLPGVTAPDGINSLLMIVAGIAWGFYSLLGRGSKRPLQETAGNFIRAAPVCLILCLLFIHKLHFSSQGVFWAVVSGSITSALGYVIWYSALKHLSSTHAATVQLSVPVIAGFLGVLLLNEILSIRLVMAAFMVITGIALVLVKRF